MIKINCTIYYKDYPIDVYFNEKVDVKQVAYKLYCLDLSRYELSELCYALINFTNLSSFLNYLIDSNIIKGYEISANKVEKDY